MEVLLLARVPWKTRVGFGGAGEAFTRLMAWGIIDDFEVQDYVYTPGDLYKVILERQPKNAKDKVGMTFYATQDFGGQYKILLLKSLCSLDDVRGRLKSLENERDIKRDEWHKLRVQWYICEDSPQ